MNILCIGDVIGSVGIAYVHKHLPALKRLGVLVNCEFEGFVTAQVPVDRLLEVSRLDGVTGLEVSKQVTLCTDSTLISTRAGDPPYRSTSPVSVSILTVPKVTVSGTVTSPVSVSSESDVYSPAGR